MYYNLDGNKYGDEKPFRYTPPPPLPPVLSKKNYIIFENTLSSDIEFFEIDSIVGVKKKNNIITIFLRGGLTHDIIFDTIKGDSDINEALNILREEITGS